MPKTKISEYSATANSNTDVASINIDEGCAPSGINNAIRAVMGHLKDFQAGTNSDSFNGPTNGAHNGSVGATTPAAGAFTTLSATGLVTAEKGSSKGITIGDVATNSNSVLRMQGTSAGKNWQIANNLNVAGLEFTPSTADGGTTYTTPAVTVLSSGNFQFNSGYGSAVTAYGCRAWVNFSGSGTVTIRASGNVSSITDNGVGTFTINFTTAITDVNYAVVTAGEAGGGAGNKGPYVGSQSTSSLPIYTYNSTGGSTDPAIICISIFR